MLSNNLVLNIIIDSGKIDLFNSSLQKFYQKLFKLFTILIPVNIIQHIWTEEEPDPLIEELVNHGTDEKSMLETETNE